jgi:chromosome segregation ATPase
MGGCCANTAPPSPGDAPTESSRGYHNPELEKQILQLEADLQKSKAELAEKESVQASLE